MLHVESEMNHIAVLNNVFLALEPQFTLLAAFGLTPQINQVLKPDYFRSNKSSFYV